MATDVPSVALLLALPLVAGVSLGVAAPIPPLSCAWVSVGLYVAAAAAWSVNRHRTCAVLAATVALAAGAGLGGDAERLAVTPSLRDVLDHAIGGVRLDSIGPEGDHDPLLLRARLAEDAGVMEDFASLRATARAVRIDGRWRDVDGGVQLSVSGELFRRHAVDWRAGRTIEAPVTFRRPARFLNPGVRDLERDLALRGTALLGSIKSARLVDVIQGGSTIDEWSADARARIRAAIERWVSPLNPLSGAIVTAVLIGDRAGLPGEVRERLQAAGTYHVIAISGGNIAILAGLAVGLLMVGGVRGRLAAVAAALSLLVYAQIVAAGPSVWRATAMAVLYLVARAVDHRTPPWQAIAVAAALMMVVDPLDVRDAGFILTFGATAALVEGAGALSRYRPDRRPGGGGPVHRSLGGGGPVHRSLGVGGWVLASVVASLAVEAALMPAAASLFSRVTFTGVGLNLLAVPLMAVVQVAGIVVVLLDTLGASAAVAGWCAHMAASSIVSSAGFVDVVPWLSARVPPPAPGWICVYYGSLLTVWFGRHTVARHLALAPLALAGAVIVSGWRMPADPAPDRLRLTMLDVGQSEAMLLELPNGPRLLIDSGGAPFGEGFDIGGRVIAPALWWRGLRTLDGLVITHGDPDHVGGALALAPIFRPRWLWEGIVVPTHEPMARVRDAATRSGARIETLRAGEERTFGDVRLRVLHPPEPDWERPRVRNDDSVVLEVVYREVAILLTADISSEVERTLIPRLTPAKHRILKVAHHGSRTSSSTVLLESWRPQWAFISAGRGNSFGHPTPQVLDRLAAIDAQVLRTDRHGQIAVETDGRSVVATSFIEETAQ
jgi:competence protein ComEC